MFTNDREAIMSMSYCTSKILIKIVDLYKHHKRNNQDINSVKMLDKSTTKDSLISKIFTILISWIFLLCLYKYKILMRILDVQYDIDIIASLSFVNINGIPVMYAVF